MRVVISVGGRFHAFNLAQQLARKDYLKKIITSYPKFETAKYGIPKEKIDSVIIKEILQRGWFSRFNPFQSLWNPTFPITELFDRAASKRVVPADIFVGWANQSLFSLKKAKSFGALGVIERGSSHILFQDRMIREEYEISRLRPAPSRLSDPRMIRRELAEYGEADYISIPSSFVK
ncbi:MAG: glycosyltransferase family 1 protein, partial [Deltaproteobacteria bacterium]|nr:glycosyltransferase family 1 protein [Deltaproteobacteria bacterium]